MCKYVNRAAFCSLWWRSGPDAGILDERTNTSPSTLPEEIDLSCTRQEQEE
ncbi:unnamed protein product, partial [Amoebophrya sp. A25]|eukprot:GSA25T00004993001.1